MCCNARLRGFTLVELVVTVLIIAILASAMIMRFRDQSEEAEIANRVSEANKFQIVAELCLAQNGVFPADLFQGKAPPEMVPFLSARAFTRPVLGGKAEWDWNGPGTSLPHFGIAVRFKTPSAANKEFARKVDAIYDDGDLSKGKIQYTGDRNIQFIIQPK